MQDKFSKAKWQNKDHIAPKSVIHIADLLTMMQAVTYGDTKHLQSRFMLLAGVELDENWNNSKIAGFSGFPGGEMKFQGVPGFPGVLKTFWMTTTIN